MGIARFSLVLCFMFFINACSAVNVQPERPIDKKLSGSYALKGTSTALVGIAINKDGLPLETVKEVGLRPGERVVFAGPDRFQIVFKNKKSPNKKVKYESQDGVIIITIPKDILTNGDYVEEYRKNKSVRFDYSIIINGKELDPPMIIKPDW